MKKGRGLRDLPHKSNGSSRVSKMELSNLLSNFKQDIINDVATQLDTMQARRKKDEADAMLTGYYPHCRERKKHCGCKFVASVETQPMPSKFKAIDENGEVINVTKRRPWAQRKGMPQDPLQSYNNNNQWKTFQNTGFSGNHTWQQPQQGWLKPQSGWQQPHNWNTQSSQPTLLPPPQQQTLMPPPLATNTPSK